MPRAPSVGLDDVRLIPDIIQIQSDMRDRLGELVSSGKEMSSSLHSISSNIVNLVTNTRNIASALQSILTAMQTEKHSL